MHGAHAQPGVRGQINRGDSKTDAEKQGKKATVREGCAVCTPVNKHANTRLVNTHTRANTQTTQPALVACQKSVISCLEDVKA